MAASMELVRSPGAAVAAPMGISEVERLAQVMARSGYFNDAREVAQAAVKVLAGQELGVPPVAAMMGINIIKGKVALGGNLIASRIKAAGYDYRHKQFDAKGCVLTFYGRLRQDGTRETLGESSFTEEDAKAAQLIGKEGDMYRKYPRNMYFNRAISNGARWYTPDVFSGIPVFTPEELGAQVDAEGEVIEVEPEKPPAPPPTPARDVVPDEVQHLWNRMTDRYAALDIFSELKDQCYVVLGNEKGEELYRTVLAASGVKKSNEFTTMRDAKRCAAAMWQAISDAKAAKDEEPFADPPPPPEPQS